MACPPPSAYDSASGGDIPARAEEIYAAFRASADEGEGASFEALCARHPDLAEHLRELHRGWQEVAGLLGSSRETPPGGVVQVLPAGALQRLFPRLAPERRYRALELHARGGMARIHRARDRLLDRTVALKVLAGPPDQADRVLRFLAEARITGQLQHPSVVPVHDLGLDEEGSPFFSMELVQGRTLGEILPLAREGRETWTLARAVRVLVQVCEAVAFAHSRGVVHRDLKPANIMVGSFGEVFVMDWGLAKILPGHEAGKAVQPLPGEDGPREDSTPRPTAAAPGSPGTTRAGDVLGTPCYMAPEQASGRQEAVGPAADIYAVGAMLYELLTGSRPYVDREGVRTAQGVLELLLRESPTPVPELDATAPAELTAICERAMARAPEARYPDMQALARDLEAWLEGRVVQAHRTGVLVEIQKWVQRNRTLAAALGLAVILLLGSIVGFGVVQGRAARILAWQNYLANLGAAEAALRGHDSGAAAQALESVEPAWQERWEWRHLHGPRLDQARAVLRAHPDPGVRQVLPGPTGRWLATASWDPADRSAAGLMPGLSPGPLWARSLSE